MIRGLLPLLTSSTSTWPSLRRAACQPVPTARVVIFCRLARAERDGRGLCYLGQVEPIGPGGDSTRTVSPAIVVAGRTRARL